MQFKEIYMEKPMMGMNKASQREWFDKFVKESETMTVSAVTSLVADSVATNAQLAKFLADSRAMVEEEAILTVDAMTLAFDGKAEKLKTLRAVTETVSSEVAFMKVSLNTVQAKTAEIETMTRAIDGLVRSLAAFKEIVDDGTLDRAAKAAEALRA